MALAHENPIDRAQVAEWIKTYHETKPDGSLEDYIRHQVEALDLSDPMVRKADGEADVEDTHIADLIIADLPSYGTSS